MVLWLELGILAWAAYCEQFPVQPAWDWAQAHSIQVELIGKGRGMLSPRRTQDTLANPGTQDTLANPTFSQIQSTPYLCLSMGQGEYQLATKSVEVLLFQTWKFKLNF